MPAASTRSSSSKPTSEPVTSARPTRHHEDPLMPYPSETDPDTEVQTLIEREIERQTTGLQLIASENFTSPAVMRAVGSVLTNKYSEGYPGKRYYGGNAVIDSVEQIAIDRAKELFGAEHANVQPHSGANANMCVYQALLAAGRHRARAQPRSRRPPHPRVAGQRQRPALPLRLVRRRRRGPDRDGQRARTGARASSEDDRRRHDELPAAPRTGAVPPHRRRGRRAVDVRHRPPRRARRRRGPPQPGAVRRHRHVHHAQDPARPARRLHPVDRRTRQGDRQGGVPRLAGRPARTRHRRQGDRLPRGDGPAVRGLRPPDRRQRVGPRRGARARGLPPRVGWHRQPPDGRRPHAVRRRTDRQAGAEHARRGRPSR